MTYILLCIIANVGILLCFKAFAQYRINTFQSIVINYMVCIATGIIYIDDIHQLTSIDITSEWVLLALLLGLVFISTFNIMATTTQRLGLTVASVASKMSLIIPVLASVMLFKVQSKEYSSINYLGIIMALAAVTLSSIKRKRGTKDAPTDFMVFLLPISVFILGGSIDAMINFINYKFITPNEEALFPIVIFTSAFTVGAIILIVRKEKIAIRSILGGVVLGVVNYFSVYFLVKALSSFKNDGALVYPVLNIGIILLSAIISVVIFKDQLLKLNKIGLAVAVLAILFIFYQEILGYYHL